MAAGFTERKRLKKKPRVSNALDGLEQSRFDMGALTSCHFYCSSGAILYSGGPFKRPYLNLKENDEQEDERWIRWFGRYHCGNHCCKPCLKATKCRLLSAYHSWCLPYGALGRLSLRKAKVMRQLADPGVASYALKSVEPF